MLAAYTVTWVQSCSNTGRIKIPTCRSLAVCLLVWHARWFTFNTWKAASTAYVRRGYEVNSPRVVEAIFYECVPVIISDNFVPSLFDVLNWEALSVIVSEKDIPNLKNILMSIPESKYLALQLAVRRAQRHFHWHAKPLKYDLFHMILHSVWSTRFFQIKTWTSWYLAEIMGSSGSLLWVHSIYSYNWRRPS